MVDDGCKTFFGGFDGDYWELRDRRAAGEVAAAGCVLRGVCDPPCSACDCDRVSYCDSGSAAGLSDEGGELRGLIV